MSGVPIPSIRLSRIDPEKCWFNPGCALSIYKPGSVTKLLKILHAFFGPVQEHRLCCHHDPLLPPGSTIINNCAGCDRRFRFLYAGIQTISLWEVLDSLEGLPLPDHQGMAVSVQDPCSYRRKPQVHAAVRSLLHKMNIRIVESEYSGTRSICCGDNFYPRLPAEKVVELQKKRAGQMPCRDVAVYCVSCMKSMASGGKAPRYLADLVLNEPTDPQDTGLGPCHEALERYIGAH